MKKIFLIIASLSFSVMSIAQTAEGSISTFRKPASEIEAITMAAPLPSTYYSNDNKKVVIGYSACKSIPIAQLAASEIRLAGVRVDPETFSLTREAYLDNLEVLDIATGTSKPVTGVPEGVHIKHVTWSPSGKYFAFTATTSKGMDLYRVEIATLSAQKISTHRLNAVLGTPYMFLDDARILYKTVPDGNTKMPVQGIATSSVVQETQGEKKSGLRTYEDLLTGPFDEIMYDYVATSILAVYENGATKLIGDPAIYRSLDPSPDGNYIIATTEHRPYSYMETHRSFPSKQFIMDLDAKVVKMLSDGTVKDDKKDADKKDGDKAEEKKAPKPSGFAWRNDLGAVLTWSETKSGQGGPGGPGMGGPMGPPPADMPDMPGAPGDKKDKKEKKPEATHTTLVYQTGAPFNFETDKTVVANPEYRMGRITWGNSGLAIYQETSTDKKVRRTVAFVPCDTLAAKKVLFEETTEIDTVGTFPVYGSAFTVKNEYGKSVVWSDAKNTMIYLSGTTRRDAEGWNYSFLDKLTLKTGAITNVWSEKGNMKHTLKAISDFGKNFKIIETMEAFDKVPDIYETDVKKGTSRQVSHIQNSVPQIPELYTKQIVSYTRKDGLKCFGSLYLPKGYDPKKDGKLPVFMWTYPYEYKTFAESEKERPDRYKYLKPTYGSAQIWASQGYAVLDEFTMAIIPHHKDSLENDVFLEQLIMSAESAIDFIVDTLGIGDRDKIGIGGHSYGGFMTANLLSHTRLFRAGVARSGAYMRSLTPFGFQSERRNYWKAKNVYDEMSPFNYADNVKDNLLIIHGMQDDNMGTFPVQSERLYQALVYFGANARFVQLPYEAHSYLGKETTLDMLYETGAWLDKYVKNAEPKKEPEKKGKPEEGK